MLIRGLTISVIANYSTFSSELRMDMLKVVDGVGSVQGLYAAKLKYKNGVFTITELNQLQPTPKEL